MQLRIVGASPAYPNPGEACSAYLVETDRARILLECGHGSVGVLRTMTDLTELSAIIISHMHPDHYFDLVPLKYLDQFVSHRSSPLPLHLPPDGESVLRSLGESAGLPEDFFSSFDVIEYDPDSPLVIGDVALRFAPTRHFISGYAMRFRSEDGEKDLFYSSDTGWDDPLVTFARGAALGLVEATHANGLDEDVDGGHLSPRLAGRFAREAEMRRLVLTHFPSPLATRVESEAQQAFGRQVELAREGRSFSV
ncbi:MAG TPA: MBL fold metallo-hydrolase [Chloroflexota bacterium]